MTALTITGAITGLCVGGCGRTVSRERVAGGSAFAKLANELPLLCDPCGAAQERALADAAEHRATSQARIECRARHSASGLPKDLRHVDLDQLDRGGCAAAIDAARGWAGRDVKGLLLTGPFGTGKSTIAAGALRVLLADRPGRWVSAPALLAHLGSGFGSDGRDWALDLVSARHALVIDDLDKARPSEYGAEIVFLAIDNAVTRGQQLLVTTNLSLGQLAAKWPAPFGEAIASRLVGYCTIIEVTGRDRRIGGRR